MQTEPNPGHSYFTTLLGNVTKSYPKFSVPIFVVGFLKVFAPPRGFRISIIPNLTNFQLSTCVLQFLAKHISKSYKPTKYYLTSIPKKKKNTKDSSVLLLCLVFFFSERTLTDHSIQGVLALCYFWDLEKIRISQKSH